MRLGRVLVVQEGPGIDGQRPVGCVVVEGVVGVLNRHVERQVPGAGRAPAHDEEEGNLKQRRNADQRAAQPATGQRDDPGGAEQRGRRHHRQQVAHVLARDHGDDGHAADQPQQDEPVAANAQQAHGQTDQQQQVRPDQQRLVELQRVPDQRFAGQVDVARHLAGVEGQDAEMGQVPGSRQQHDQNAGQGHVEQPLGQVAGLRLEALPRLPAQQLTPGRQPAGRQRDGRYCQRRPDGHDDERVLGQGGQPQSKAEDQRGPAPAEGVGAQQAVERDQHHGREGHIHVIGAGLEVDGWIEGEDERGQQPGAPVIQLAADEVGEENGQRKPEGGGEAGDVGADAEQDVERLGQKVGQRRPEGGGPADADQHVGAGRAQHLEDRHRGARVVARVAVERAAVLLQPDDVADDVEEDQRRQDGKRQPAPAAGRPIGRRRGSWLRVDGGGHG